MQSSLMMSSPSRSKERAAARDNGKPAPFDDRCSLQVKGNGDCQNEEKQEYKISSPRSTPRNSPPAPHSHSSVPSPRKTLSPKRHSFSSGEFKEASSTTFNEYKTNEMKDNNNNNTQADADTIITEFGAKMFWKKHFGFHECEILWDTFEAAFQTEFGSQPSVSIHKLESVLSNKDLHTVNVYDYNTFTSANGLYQGFQKLVDPGRAVYVLGSVEDETPLSSSLMPFLVEGLLGIAVSQVSCGGQHAVVLTDTGDVYSWGKGSFGRLGHGTSESILQPKKIEGLKGTNIAQISCGFAYTTAVSDSGKLYAWGAGENGRLGTGDTSDRLSPTHVYMAASKKVRQVFAGSVHTCALTADGLIYSFGKSEYTGHGSSADILSPQVLDEFNGKNICQISVGPGGYHTIALAVSGEVYTWGHNRVGQLGFENKHEFPRNDEGAFFLPKPRLVESISHLDVCQVVAGWGHSAILTNRGKVFICGRNLRGQLGLGNPEKFPKNERGHPFVSKFTEVAFPTDCKVSQVACGGEHTAVIMDNGDIYAFGSGNKGQIGEMSSMKSTPKLFEPLRNMRRPAVQIACGNNCTLFLAASFSPPSLKQLCIETLRKVPLIYDYIDQLNIPEDLVVQFSDLSVEADAMDEEHKEEED
jgi:alpha-tubulin suppressor-like RCC1 family protein